MSVSSRLAYSKRYASVAEKKASGETYTPKPLSDFVARQILQAARLEDHQSKLRILDPAVGDGELLLSLLTQLQSRPGIQIEVYGFEINHLACAEATARLRQHFPFVSVCIEEHSFLAFVLEHFGESRNEQLFSSQVCEKFDLIIANPPYVRTQIMGASQSQNLAKQFGLIGRADLYHAFLMGMAQALRPQGVAGIIISNRFMTTKAGASIRAAIREGFNIRHVWDLGDTKLFEAAVLPAVLLVEGRNDHTVEPPNFTSVYETDEIAESKAPDPVGALAHEGVVEVLDGRRFNVRHGKLDSSGPGNAVWRIATKASDAWLATVEAHTWGTFRNIGKIRVGVKTCADKIFIRSDWNDMPVKERPELLRLLTTHHIAHRFRALESKRSHLILYTHEVENGRRCVVNLDHYPRSRVYLEQHRATLEGRKYVLQAGRKWFELWVPQDPAAWKAPKLVFRDIADEPIFWIDQLGTVVNGDCYWITVEKLGSEDLLWLAVAVGNSKFIEAFYDHKFHNKLYAGRRRFITQYVEQFPLPDPKSRVSRLIIAKAKAAYDAAGTDEGKHLANRLDRLVWEAFGLPVEEVTR